MISSRSSEMSRMAVPLLALLQQQGVDVLGGANVHAARGLGGDQHARLAREFARQHHFLDVAAGQALDSAYRGMAS